MSWHAYMEALDSVWETPFDLGGRDIDHPIGLSPDWPPPTSLDLSIHLIKSRYPSGPIREKMIGQILKRYGYQPDWLDWRGKE